LNRPTSPYRLVGPQTPGASGSERRSRRNRESLAIRPQVPAGLNAGCCEPRASAEMTWYETADNGDIEKTKYRNHPVETLIVKSPSTINRPVCYCQGMASTRTEAARERLIADDNELFYEDGVHLFGLVRYH